MKFWLQTRAPNGNWVDNLGSNNKQSCISHGRYLAAQGEMVRVIERTDKEIWS